MGQENMMTLSNSQMYSEEEEPVSSQIEAKLQAVLNALEAFVAADSWAAARCVLEAHPRELLTDVVDDVLVTLMARYKDAEIVRVLAQHRRVLMRCRVVGIDVAFAELASEDIPCPEDIDPNLWQRALQIEDSTTMMDLLAEYPDLITPIRQRMSYILGEAHVSLLDGMLSFLEADSWTAARHIVESLPSLLSFEADLWLMQYSTSLRRVGNYDAVTVVEMRRWLLARCRMIGVGAAFGARLAMWDGVQIESSDVPLSHWMMQDVVQAL
jgi:hypothetical protein